MYATSDRLDVPDLPLPLVAVARHVQPSPVTPASPAGTKQYKGVLRGILLMLAVDS